MGLVLRFEELQRGRRDHAEALDAGSPGDGLLHRRTGDVLNREASFVGSGRGQFASVDDRVIGQALVWWGGH